VKTINPNVYPHGGMYFQDSDGSKHVGQTWPGVIARVQAYRKRQGRPVDTVANEVIFQACNRTPNLCVEDNGVTQAQVKVASLKSRVLQWLAKLREVKEPRMYVDTGLQMARTDVCLRCPNHQGLPGGCGTCVAALKALKEEIVGTRPFDKRLEACSVSGEYLPVATWLDDPAVANDALPGHCWRKRSI
jgi:hypothetical protein